MADGGCSRLFVANGGERRGLTAQQRRVRACVEDGERGERAGLLAGGGGGGAAGQPPFRHMRERWAGKPRLRCHVCHEPATKPAQSTARWKNVLGAA